MTWPWIVAAATAGLIAGPRLRGSIFSRSVESGEPTRHACPACTREIGPAGHRWRALLPAGGRCPACRARIGPAALAVELAAGLALGWPALGLTAGIAQTGSVPPSV